MVDVRLHGASRLRGRRIRGAVLRDLTGADELAAYHLSDALTVEVATGLLAACLVTLCTDDGDLPAATGDARELSAGDREVLLLSLRRNAYGDRLDLVVTCPDVACASRMDIAMSVSDLLRETPAEHPADETGDAGVRPVTGDDLHAVAALALDDPDRAARQLAARVAPSAGDGATLDASSLAAVDAALARIDPHADHELMLACPECGLEFRSSIDAGELLRQEIGVSITELDVSVHLMASHYHWPERDIVALPIARRRRYLRVLGDALPAPVGC